MAEIYLGKAVGEAAFQKIVAIKRILPHYSGDKEFIEMFRDEAHICKRLQHNNIVQVYDFTEVDGSYALVMEHVDGADLRSLLSACETAKTRLSVPMALFISACAARALHYAHTKTDEITNEPLGIVHRDISPQNILISYEGDVKITDFGIASAENKLTETRPGVVKGKYSYMSPEQVAAKPLDGRSDVFSLAIVLWESLAMKRLFAGMTEVESIRKVQNCEVPFDICELNPEVDQELKALVMKGLAKDRKQRYQTAAAFEKDLLRYLHSHYAEYTSRELGNFLKRILAKKRDRTQDDIKETLNQAVQAAPAQMKSNPISQMDVQPISAAMPISAVPPKAMGMGIGDARSIPEQAELPISLSGQYRKGTPPPRSLITDNNYNDGWTNTRTRGGGQGRSSVAAMPPPVRKKQNSKLPLLIVILGLGAGAAYHFRDEVAFDKKMHVELRTVPDTVSLRVNGVKLEDGNYKKTPLKLGFYPGSYELEINRPGYQREVVRFQGQAGETMKPPKVFLKRLPNVTLQQVKILSTADKIAFDIDGGLFEGEVPATVELLPGSPHIVMFHAVDNNTAYKCPFRFEKPSSPSSIPTLMITPPSGNQKPRCQIKN